MKSFVLAAATVATFAVFGLGSEAEAGHCNAGRGVYGRGYGPVYGPGYGSSFSTHHHHHGHGYGSFNRYPSYGPGYGYGGYGYGSGYHGHRGYRGSSFGISTPSFGLYVR